MPNFIDEYLGPRVDEDGGPGWQRVTKLIVTVTLIIMREINILRQEINTINSDNNLKARTIEQLKDAVKTELES